MNFPFKEDALYHLNCPVLSCSDCDFQTNNERQLDVHFDNIHKFKCSTCSYHGTNERDLNRHIATMHNKEFTCDECAHDFSSLKILQNHKVTKHNMFATRFFQKQRETSNRRYSTTKSFPNSKAFNGRPNVDEGNSNKPHQNLDQMTRIPSFWKCTEENCLNIPNNFSSQDAYDLHMEYFHSSQSAYDYEL